MSRDEPLAPACVGCRENSGTCFPHPCKRYAERQEPMMKFTGPKGIWAFLPPGTTFDGHPRERTEEEIKYQLRMFAIDAYDQYRVSGKTDLHECIDVIIDRVRPLLEACGIAMAADECERLDGGVETARSRHLRALARRHAEGQTNE